MAQPTTNADRLAGARQSCAAPACVNLRVHEGGASRGPAGRQPPTLPEPGTRVVLLGGNRHGVVKPYEAQWSHGSFPVRFDDCQWLLMWATDLVLEEPTSAGSR